MTDKSDAVTKANEDGKTKLADKGPIGGKKLADAENVSEVNEAADAEFNHDRDDVNLGNRVGGLRGGAD